MDIDNLPSEKLRDLEESLQELQRRKLADPIGHYEPYPKQQEFHNLGISKRERALIAANQIGKSYSASMETAIHLTGHYPDWWQGKRFNKPVRGWVLGQTSEAVRDTVQRLLLGPLNAPGTGAIPKDAIQNRTLARGVSDAVDTVIIRHKSGGYSQLSFRSYGRGREKLQGESLDFIHVDEEPPADIYTELLARISARKGILYATFTPLLGMSEVVQRFLSDSSGDRAYVQAGIADALHISPEERQKIIDGYPSHEREARAEGVPMLGSGRIYPFDEAMIRYDAGEFQIPKHFVWIAGLDLGWAHATSGVKCAWDRESDAFYVTNVYKRSEATPLIHAGALRQWGTWLPWAWPHDGLQTSKDTGQQLAQVYRDHGLNMLEERATFPDGGSSVEAGIIELQEAMQTGRFRVAKHLEDFWSEFRMYHRKEGRIVKENDDVLDAVRYAWMMRRHSKIEGQGRSGSRPMWPRSAVTEYDIYSPSQRPPSEDINLIY
ncbi:MAG: terminase family protein [Sedimenticola sp.]